MKKLLFATILVVITTACTNYYQVLRVTVPSNAVVSAHEIACNDQDMTLTYNFWDNNGNLSFRLYNNSAETMHIYLDETFLVKNGFASDYLELSKIHNKMNKYGSSTVAIPAGAHRFFVCPHLQNEIFEYCDIELCPSGEVIQEKNFTKEDTPLSFSIEVTYSLGQNPNKKMTRHSFYINQTVNYRERDFERQHDDTLRFCNEEEVIPVQDLRSPDKFYIKY